MSSAAEGRVSKSRRDSYFPSRGSSPFHEMVQPEPLARDIKTAGGVAPGEAGAEAIAPKRSRMVLWRAVAGMAMAIALAMSFVAIENGSAVGKVGYYYRRVRTL